MARNIPGSGLYSLSRAEALAAAACRRGLRCGDCRLKVGEIPPLASVSKMMNDREQVAAAAGGLVDYGDGMPPLDDDGKLRFRPEQTLCGNEENFPNTQ